MGGVAVSCPGRGLQSPGRSGGAILPPITSTHEFLVPRKGGVQADALKLRAMRLSVDRGVHRPADAGLARAFRPANAQAAAPVATTDGPLVDPGRQRLEAIAEEGRILAPCCRLGRFTCPPGIEARRSGSRSPRCPPSTMPDLQAEARVVLLWLAPDGELPVDEGDADAQLAWSLCRDLLKVASA